MYNKSLIDKLQLLNKKHKISSKGLDLDFNLRFAANIDEINSVFTEIYGEHPAHLEMFDTLLEEVVLTFKDRNDTLKQRDAKKLIKNKWFLDNSLVGMSLYVDRFAGHLNQMPKRLDYLENLGVNFLHLMPLFESPENESDGGYAVSNFRKIDARFGTIDDLKALQEELQKRDMYLMIDIVLNHTSYHHEWAKRAISGEKEFQDFYYFYDDRTVPDRMELSMPEIFPETSPGNFTYVENLQKWVMSVFYYYQWDLNYRNPRVLVEMLKNIFYYANLGVDVLRIDAPAFIWKEEGTNCQNLPKAHKLLQLLKLCVEVASPGMALLGEAIVAPAQIMEYFGTGRFTAHECDFAYNATQMALQWDAIATADTRIMLEAQHELMRKPLGTTWLTYTRCHDDIGLGYDDYMIENAGLDPYLHRTYLKNYFSGVEVKSVATGALFGVNPKTNDARISGSLASLCGLEKAKQEQNEAEIHTSIQRILLMQAQSFFIGGVPMLFYGDEAGYENDYSYLSDPGKSMDNRWMHRPIIDWNRNNKVNEPGTTEHTVFENTRRLLQIRKDLPVMADMKNTYWLPNQNNAIAGFLRHSATKNVYCLFNFSNTVQSVSYFVLGPKNQRPERVKDLWTGQNIRIGEDNEYLLFEPYQFYILEA